MLWSVVCNEPNILFCTLHVVVFINESENKMKVINFVCGILGQTYPSIICYAHEMNIQRQTSVISNFLYIEVFTQVP